MARFLLICFSLLLSGRLIGQVNRYVVYFKDKEGTPYSLAQPEKFLSTASINRRTKQQISFADDDLPVNPTYVANIKAAGGKTFFTSRWLNCLLIEGTASIVAIITQLPEVTKVEYVAPGSRLIGGRIAKKWSQNQTNQAETALVQYQQLGIDQMQAAGFTGQGVNIAVFDGGFLGVDRTQPFQKARNQIKYVYNFVQNTKTVYSFDDHGTEVFSIIAAQSANFIGGAYDANYHLFVTEDVSSEYRIEEYNWLFAAERADSLGIDIISASVGYNTFDDSSMDYRVADLNGSTSIVSKAASTCINKGIMVVTSAGNEGNGSWKRITMPADAKGILTIGSITAQQFLSSFSSVGPSADGRIKPDVVALGSSASVINGSGYLVAASGTSFSCPLITSLVAGTLQAYPSLSVEKLYNAIIRSGDQAYNPDNKKGYGLPNFKGIKNFLEATLLDNPIVISPNPVSNNLMKITFKEPKDEDITIILSDPLGRPLSIVTSRMSWQNNPLEFDLSALAAGVYVVQIKSISQSLTSRILKL